MTRTLHKSKNKPKVIVRKDRHLMRIILNRPNVINSLDIEMIRLFQQALDQAEASQQIKLVLIRGNGEKGFCAGGDIKKIAQSVKSKAVEDALMFLKEEYTLDLRIHNFPKPVVAFADGITMGGGLGLAAGADLVVATERSRMAMPETRIGFFPDVGATGWMFTKCPKGYPEFLGLTGYEISGPECVRLGLASHFVLKKNLASVVQRLETQAVRLPTLKQEAVHDLHYLIESTTEKNLPQNPGMDDWVGAYFAGKTSLEDILTPLSNCLVQDGLCREVFDRISERSPTALVLTLKLLRYNEGRPMADVFGADISAARFIVGHPDYLEGVRARILDKDDNPQWQPNAIEKVKPEDVVF